MVKIIWNFLGDLKLAFWLLLTASGILVIGSYYTNAHFSFFRTLNETRIQDWLAQYLLSHFHLTWWLPLLFVAMGLLGMNIFICTTNRIIALIHLRKKMKRSLFIVRLAPSVIHLIFLYILIGHLMTFTLGRWERVSLEQGKTITIGEKTFNVNVRTISNTYYPENSSLRDRISQTSVLLNDADGNNLALSYLHPVHYRGHYLFLDMIKQRKKDSFKKQPVSTIFPKGETCNKAPVFHANTQKNNQKLLLLCVSDPGRLVIISGLAGILIVMIAYFVALIKKKTI